ncbi:hypothetical protein PITC_002570 [Penicillium italicum]|uniref:Xylanolytic transcriptional activator regulatory domain-containing protein n=1 Tax=Penicillium italicum TaxID=40296 RepID=A0A0A2L3E1_PENIT|nr:hypothetical protein PITC_002570 [Penicillium italicum]
MQIEDSGEPAFIGPSGNFCFPVAPHRSKSTEKRSAEKPMMARLRADSTETHKLDVSEITHRQHLIDIFIHLINPIHQFLDTATLFQIQQENLSPQLGLLQNAVLAAAALLSDDPASEALGCEMAYKVEQTALQSCRQHPSVLVIQALSIMCWRELALDQNNMGWMYNCASYNRILWKFFLLFLANWIYE